MKFEKCHCCLKPETKGFCLKCRKALFKGTNVSPILPFTKPEYANRKREHGEKLSISGVQPKHSLKLENGELILTENHGEYILKTDTKEDFEYTDFMPHNEHLTMQLAKQVFEINTAESALVFFKDDLTPAYLTKRFDVNSDGTRKRQEDFAQILGRTSENSGAEYKYNSSYEAIANKAKEFVGPYLPQIEKYFNLLIFNYLVNNEDAHLKNFSLIEDPKVKSFVFTPAYDLLNTRLHLPNEGVMALDIFEDENAPNEFIEPGFPSSKDFLKLAEIIKVNASRARNTIKTMIAKKDELENFVGKSFLPINIQSKYIYYVNERIKALKIGLD